MATMLGSTGMKQDPVAAAKEQEEEGPTEAVRDVDSEGSVSGRSGDEQELGLARTVTGPPYSIFTPRAKIFIVVAVSISSLISPFGGTTFLPALEPLARDLHVTPTLINLSLTTYMVRPSSIVVRIHRGGLTTCRSHKASHQR